MAVSLVRDAIAGYAIEIADLTARRGRPVVVDEARVADRSGAMALKAPGVWSPNRSCRMVRAADGWIAVNLPREADRWAVPAWIGCKLDADPWRAIIRGARTRRWRDLVDQAALLGLPACGVGEAAAPGGDGLVRMAEGATEPLRAAPKVLDLSSLWAGPLCGALLARAGCEVTKLESLGRPDVLRDSAPAMFHDLNAGKTHARLDFTDAGDVARLRDLISGADVVITSARPRAFEQFGMPPREAFARNPRLVWVAVSGYGWMGPGADRVAFGDDAAAAGGLVRWTRQGEPRFLGDALADPLTGLFAARGALRALARGGGFLVDAAMAQASARAAVSCR